MFVLALHLIFSKFFHNLLVPPYSVNATADGCRPGGIWLAGMFVMITVYDVMTMGLLLHALINRCNIRLKIFYANDGD